MNRIKVKACLGGFALAAVLAAEGGMIDRKLIGIGHEFYDKTVDDVLAVGAEFRKTPLDGIGFALKLPKDGGRGFVRAADSLSSEIRWSKDDLRDTVAKFARITPETGLTDNFIYVFRHPLKRISWDDDARWAQIAGTYRSLAWACREGGLKGFVIDPEDYGRQHQFERLSSDEPFDVLAPKVRARARQMFRGVFEEYPDITLLAYWLFSLDRDLFAARDMAAATRERGTLWPAFVNGILDVATDRSVLVDATESAYRCRARFNDFDLLSVQLRNTIAQAAPENRAKFRAVQRVGFGLWLGMYLKDEDRPYTKNLEKWVWEDPVPTFSGRLAENIAQALRAADGYVWLYTASERKAWVHWPEGIGSDWKTWDESFPNIPEAIRIGRDPSAWFAARLPELEREGRLVGVLDVKAKVPSKNLSGGQKNDYVVYPVRGVKAGELYGIRATVSGDDVQAVVRWRSARQSQRPTAVPVVPLTFAEPYAGKPRTVCGCVQVPNSVDDLDFAVRALPSAVPARVEAVELWKVDALEDVKR